MTLRWDEDATPIGDAVARDLELQRRRDAEREFARVRRMDRRQARRAQLVAVRPYLLLLVTASLLLRLTIWWGLS